MALLHRPTHREAERGRRTDVPQQRQAAAVDDSAAVYDRQSVRTSEGRNLLLRALGAIVGGAAVVLGLVALIRIDWTNGLDSAAVKVLDIAFTPAVAIATVALGLVALIAGAVADRTAKLVVGVVLGCVGLGILLAGSRRSDWQLERAHGWMALVAGAVLLITGMLMRNYWETRRSVRSEGYAR